MKIVALNPPFLTHYSRESRSPAVAKSGSLYYPMWLSYAVGYLEKQGHEVLLIDAPAQGLTHNGVVDTTTAFQPGLVVISTSTPSIYNDIDVGIAIKKVHPAYTSLIGKYKYSRLYNLSTHVLASYVIAKRFRI